TSSSSRAHARVRLLACLGGRRGLGQICQVYAHLHKHPLPHPTHLPCSVPRYSPERTLQTTLTSSSSRAHALARPLALRGGWRGLWHVFQVYPLFYTPPLPFFFRLVCSLPRSPPPYTTLFRSTSSSSRAHARVRLLACLGGRRGLGQICQVYA